MMPYTTEQLEKILWLPKEDAEFVLMLGVQIDVFLCSHFNAMKEGRTVFFPLPQQFVERQHDRLVNIVMEFYRDPWSVQRGPDSPNAMKDSIRFVFRQIP